jgi:helix-turn-helix protein
MSISLDSTTMACYRSITMKYPLSTVQVAELLKMHQSALQRLIREKRIPCPPLTQVGGMRIRLWSKKDVDSATAVLRRKKK